MSDIIRKPEALHANLTDYAAERAAFSWAAARARLDGLPGGGLNIAHEAVERHAAGPRANHVALRWIPKRGEPQDWTYAQLSAASSRFANALQGLGVKPGERLYLLMGRVPELHVAVLGALKARCVVCPLFAAFGPEPIQQRMEIGEGAVLLTTARLYKRKVAEVRDRLPVLRHVIVVDEGAPPEGTLSLSALLDGASDAFAIAPTDPEDPALLHFTSGTTGKPKGVVHVHAAVQHHHVSAFYALDLRPDDIFWCTADPGWVTGMSYGVIAPLTHGCTLVLYEPEFEAEDWYRVLRDEGVTVWYTAPTAVRMMMRMGAEVAQRYALPRLRFIASVGEPLDPEGVRWGVDAFGLPIHDNWWQSETGGIMIANFAASEIRPGSMGRPLPGIEAAIARIDADGVTLIDDPAVQGELVLRAGWPSMFRAYLGLPERYARCFIDGWYRSGDLARRDADGFFWFVGRADDVINTSGHLVGPFEVESALMEHPAVAEVGVIGKPDPVAMEVVKAFVALKPGAAPTEDLLLELRGLARQRLGPAIAPKEITFVAALPKTRSGKVMRRLLKALELGLPTGDTSTLEGGAFTLEVLDAQP
ncbi:MAG: acetate--CoA ligase [Alphaproteobacteria bacterium]|nr:acetate--CoA ligase [Alphaproteobacteria bacterium]